MATDMEMIQQFLFRR